MSIEDIDKKENNKNQENIENENGENFEKLLEESFKREDKKSGDLTEGIIVQINEDENQAIIDIGQKNEAIISLDQLRDENGNLLFQKEDKIPVIITGYRGERPLVSYELAKKKQAIREFIEEYDDSQEYIVEGKIVRQNKGGYIVDVDGLEFFMPKTLSYINQKKNPIGKKVKALIIKVEKDKDSVVISRKDLIKRERKQINEIINKLLESKEPVVGVVKKITSFGMFVDVGGVDGLVHYTEISHKGPVNPAKYFKEGDEVSVVATNYDKEKRHLSLSVKDATPDPWSNIDEILEVGDTVSAIVSNIEPYGAFVDLGEDLEAFLHVSEISWDKNVRHPKDYLKINQEINVEIIEIDKEKRRLRVSLKSLLPKPMDEFTKKYKVGDRVKGVISSLTEFGAFVKIDSVEGLLHNQEASWDKSKKAKDLFKVGDEVEVEIINIDKDLGKISLSKKVLEKSPLEQFASKHKVGDIVSGKVKDKKDFGIFIAIDENIDALIRSEDLYPLKFDEIKEGEEIKGVITHLDPKNDRIRVSVKRLQRQEEKNALKKINRSQDDSMTLGDILKEKLKK
jgi:small subunit ribosomal protein S1